MLTGSHVLLVSYNGQTTSHDVTLGVDHIGEVVAVKLPAVKRPLNLVAVTVAVVSAIILITGGTIFILRLKRMANGTLIVAPSTAIHGVIAGSVGQSPVGHTLRPVPAISVFTPQPVPVNPAPWELPRALAESLNQAQPTTPVQTSTVPQPVQQAQPTPTTTIPQPAQPTPATTIPQTAPTVQPTQPTTATVTPKPSLPVQPAQPLNTVVTPLQSNPSPAANQPQVSSQQPLQAPPEVTHTDNEPQNVVI